MNIKAQKKVILKRNFKNLMSILLPIAKKVISNKINQIKLRIIHKIVPNRGQNTLKRVYNREIKSLENNFSVKSTKNIINTPKIVIEKPPIVAESKVDTKPKNVSKPKIIDKSEIVTQKKHQNYDEPKNRVIKQLKKHLKKLSDAKKSRYLDDEYKGIRDLNICLKKLMKMMMIIIGQY